MQELVVIFLFNFRSLLSICLDGVAQKVIFSHPKVIIKIVRHILKARRGPKVGGGEPANTSNNWITSDNE